MFPPALSRVYGARSGKFAFSLLFSTFSLSTLAGAAANKYILPHIGYENLFFMCGGFCVIALGILYFYHPVNHAKHAVAKKYLY